MMNDFEKDLMEILNEWALKGHGIALTQINTAFFMQVLRSKGYEITKLGDLQKIRHEHQVITSQVSESYRQLVAAKQRIEMLNTQKEDILILKEEVALKAKRKPKEEKNDEEEKNDTPEQV